MKNDPGLVKAICQRCGSRIQLGRAKYDLHVEVVADFDGYLPDLEDTEEQIERTLGEIAPSRRSDLEDDVHQEFTLSLCRPCMREVVKGLKESPKGTVKTARRRKVTIQ